MFEKINLFGNESIFYIVGIHQDKTEFIKEAQEYCKREIDENSLIAKDLIYRGYLYGDIKSENSHFSRKEKAKNIRKYGNPIKCFYIEDTDLEYID